MICVQVHCHSEPGAALYSVHDASRTPAYVVLDISAAADTYVVLDVSAAAATTRINVHPYANFAWQIVTAVYDLGLAAEAAADEFRKQEQARKDDWEAAETLRLENEAQRKQAADDAEAERVRKRQAKLEETNAAKARKLEEARDKYEKELKTLQEKQNAEQEKIQKTYDDILAEHEVDVAKILEQAADMESDKLPHPMALNPPAASTIISLVQSDDEDDGARVVLGDEAPEKSGMNMWMEGNVTLSSWGRRRLQAGVWANEGEEEVGREGGNTQGEAEEENEAGNMKLVGDQRIGERTEDVGQGGEGRGWHAWNSSDVGREGNDGAITIREGIED
ncbi:hypothetical protein B0H13DRAFT_1865042 [Mycena leptocephala]|nr:hypothetical protein B0H13DRAFT_1865042 [Mycena leptocephala]